MDGKIPDAIAVEEQVLELERNLFGTKDEELIRTFHRLVSSCLQQERIVLSVNYAVKEFKIAKKIWGKTDHPTVTVRWFSDCINCLAAAPAKTRQKMLDIEAKFNQHYSVGDYKLVAEMALTLVPIEAQILGKDHVFLRTLFSLAAECLNS